MASAYPESKDIFDKPILTHTKPSSTVLKETNPQQTGATSVGRGSASAGRPNGSGFGSRYGFSRRNPGILFRGNSSRMLNGNKPAITSQMNLPDRTQNHGTRHTLNSATSRSSSGSGTHSQATSDTYNVDKSQSSSGSKPEGSTISQSSGSNPSTSHSSPDIPSNTDSAGSSQSTSHRGSHRGSHSPATLPKTQSSHTSPERDTTYNNGNDDGDDKNTDAEFSSSSKPQPTVEVRREEERKEDSSNGKPVVPHTRMNPSFAERFPRIKSRYPGRFGQGTRASSSRQEGRPLSTRTSSSVGAGRPLSRGVPTRVSGATGAAGVSTIQETSADLGKQDSLKNGVGESSVKPPLTNHNTVSSDSRNPTTSSSSSSSSGAATSSNSESRHSSGGHRDSSVPVHRETSDSSDQNEGYLDERSRELSRNNDKVADPTAAQRNHTLPSANRNLEDNESVDTRETASRTRPSLPSGGALPYRRPGMGGNGRVRSSLLANRPFRAQPSQNSRLGSSTSDGSSTSSDAASSSNIPQPVLTSDRDVASGNTVTKTGVLIRGNSQSTSSSSASSSSSRDRSSGQRGRSRSSIVRGKLPNGGQVNGNGNVD